MNFLERIQELLLDGYEAEKARATTRLIARISRGNISAQNGHKIDEASLARLRLEGEKAIKRIDRKIARAS